MQIDSRRIVSMTEANQNFSRVVKQCEEDGCCVIFRNNKPKFVLLDIESFDLALQEADDNLEEIAKKEFEKAKWL